MFFCIAFKNGTMLMSDPRAVFLICKLKVRSTIIGACCPNFVAMKVLNFFKNFHGYFFYALNSENCRSPPNQFKFTDLS